MKRQSTTTKKVAKSKVESTTSAQKKRKVVSKKRVEEYEDEVNAEVEEEENIDVKPPGQKMITALELKPIVMKLHGRNYHAWTEEEKKDLAKFMANRTGINNSNRSERYKEFEEWFRNYTDLLEADAEFSRICDPWYVAVHGITCREYVQTLESANAMLGGTASNVGKDGEPIVFFHQMNTFLHIPAGREAARRLQSFLQGRLGENFHCTVIDSRTTLFQ